MVKPSCKKRFSLRNKQNTLTKEPENVHIKMRGINDEVIFEFSSGKRYKGLQKNGKYFVIVILGSTMYMSDDLLFQELTNQ